MVAPDTSGVIGMLSATLPSGKRSRLTKPDRNILFDSVDVQAVGETDLEAYVFENAFTGTKPKRNIAFSMNFLKLSKALSVSISLISFTFICLTD